MRGLAEVSGGRAVGIDDVLGEQVLDCIAAGRDVGGEEVIECAVLADQDDGMFDRTLSGMFVFIWIWQWGSQSRPKADLEDRERYQALAQNVPQLRHTCSQRHFSSVIEQTAQ